MKRLFCAFVAVLALSVVGVASAADKNADKAAEKTSIMNNTNVTFSALSIAPTKSGKWEANLLEQKKLANGDIVDIMASHMGDAEAWDIQVTTPDGKTMTWVNVPINKAGQVTLLPDGEYMAASPKTMKPSAEGAKKEMPAPKK